MCVTEKVWIIDTQENSWIRKDRLKDTENK